MLYRDFGNTGFKVSTIGMGTWNIGNQWGNIDDATSLATMQSAFENGVNLFDTAEGYGIPPGLSEKRLGQALAGIRQQVYVISKTGSWGRREGYTIPKTSPDIVRLCAHACLYRLRTDWVDVMLCHEGDIEEPSIYLEGFERLKQQGHIRAYGISTNELEVLKRFNVNNTCQVLEIDYSLLNRKPESEILPYCQEHGIAVVARGPLSKGLLSGKYSADTVFTDTIRTKWHTKEKAQKKFKKNIAKVEKLKAVFPSRQEMITAALHYVVSHPAQPVAIPGAKSPEQAAMNAIAGDKILSAEERETLKNATKTTLTSSDSGIATALAG